MDTPATLNDASVAFGSPAKDASGLVGEAIAFTGDSGLRVLDNIGTKVFDWDATDSFAIEIWVKRSAGSFNSSHVEVLIGRDDTNASNPLATDLHWWIGLTDSGAVPHVVARLGDADGDGTSIRLNGSNPSPTPVVDGQWHQIILVRDAANLKNILYVDGQEEATADVDYTTHPLGFEATQSSMDIGWLGISTGTQTDYTFNGSIDQIAMYGEALTATQVEQIYQIGHHNHALNDEFAPIYSAGTTDLGVSAQGYAVTVNAIPAANPAPTAYSLDVNAPAGMTVNGSGQVSWMPTSQQIGVSNFSVNATNTIGSGTGSYTIDIVDPCATDLDAYWHLEEDGSGASPGDSVYASTQGTGLTGQCAAGGCPAQDTATGQVNNAQTFDGSTGIDVPAVVSADQVFDWAATDSFTIEFWMKRAAGGLPSNNDTEVIIGRWDIPNQLQYWVGVRNIGGNLRIAAKLIALGGENDVLIADGPTGTNVTDGNWHHVALVRDWLTTQTRLYVDGSLEASDTHDYAANFTSADVALNMGYLPGGSYGFTGSLDEVALYANALDAQVLLQHATLNSGRGYCNSAPVITSAAVTTADTSTDYSYDADASDADGDSVTWSLTNGPSGMTIDSNTGVVSWAQADISAAAGTTVPVEIQATDAYGGIDTQTFNITVSGVANVPPQITGQQTLSTSEATALTITLADLTIVDPDSTTFTLTVMDGTNYTSTGNTITPDAGFTGTLTVPVKVNDGTSDSNTFDLSVTVAAAGTTGGGGGSSGCFIATSGSTDTLNSLKWFGLLSLAGLASGAILTGRKNHAE